MRCGRSSGGPKLATIERVTKPPQGQVVPTNLVHELVAFAAKNPSVHTVTLASTLELH